MAQRYAAALRQLTKGAGDLVVDANIAPSLTGDGQGFVYRLGKAAERRYVFADFATQATTVLATQGQLAAGLASASASAKPVDAARLSLEDVDYDAKAGRFTFGALGQGWAYDVASAKLTRRDSPQDAPATLLSPDGKRRVVARDFNLYVQDVASGREVALTHDGTAEQPYGRGIAPLNAMVEHNTQDPPMPVSAQWSPDGRYLLSWRLDTRGVQPLSVTQYSPEGSFAPHSFHYIYPLAGAKVLPLARRLVINVDEAMKRGKARIVPLAMPAEELLYPADPDMGWVNGAPRMLWTERGYGRQVVYAADPDTGAVRVLAEEAVKPVVTVTSTMLMPAPALKGELVISERSGWAQLYLVTPQDPKGGKRLTSGTGEVLSVDYLAEDGSSLIVTGVGQEAGRNPYWRGLYRVDVASGQQTNLTPEPLDHDAVVSRDGRWIVDQMSSPNSPTRAVLRDGRSGAIVKELARADDSGWKAAGFTDPELFEGLAADGKTPIWGMIIRPAHFDPALHYPVIDNVYTGPTTTDVPASFADAHRVPGNGVAQLGAIVVMIDGTGTSRRGQQFRLPAFQNLGEVGLDDHIGLIRQMAQRYPYMDISRVGVFGGSAGGYDAARFVLRRPGFFKVAVAASGNHELRLDKAWWPEVSMGLADDATWQRNSNLSVAGKLTGKLLIVHGEIDDNVPITASYRLEKALIDAGRDVDMVVVPNARHGVYQPYTWRKFLDYFALHLLGETPPPLAPPAVPPPAAPTPSGPSSSH